ncbi:MAG: cupin domain-containing protein [archaeon]
MKFSKVILAPGGEMKAHSNGASEELIVVVRGTAAVSFGGVEREASAGGHLLIPRETLHSVRNRGSAPLEYYYILPEKN